MAHVKCTHRRKDYIHVPQIQYTLLPHSHPSGGGTMTAPLCYPTGANGACQMYTQTQGLHTRTPNTIHTPTSLTPFWRRDDDGSFVLPYRSEWRMSNIHTDARTTYTYTKYNIHPYLTHTLLYDGRRMLPGVTLHDRTVHILQAMSNIHTPKQIHTHTNNHTTM